MAENLIIKSKCPDCPNDEFRIIKVLSRPKGYKSEVNTMLYKSGHYRCECTVCGLIQTFKSKSPQDHA